MGNKPLKIKKGPGPGRRDIRKVLTPSQMKYIQWALSNPEKSHMTYPKIAKRFHIANETIQKIMNGDYGFSTKDFDYEKKVNKKIEKYLDTFEDCYYFKNNQVSRRGLPDYIVCIRGWFVAIECKRSSSEGLKKGRGRYMQQYWNLKKIHQAGGLGITCTPDNLADVKLFLKEIQEDITNDKTHVSEDKKYKFLKWASETIGSLEIFPEDELQRSKDSRQNEKLREPVRDGVEQDIEKIRKKGLAGECDI